MSQLPELADLGLTPDADDVLRHDHAVRLARTLDLDDDVLAGGELPITWIWVFFTPTAPTAGLRPDGHPRAGGSGALAGLDRRMFAGGSLERTGPVRLDVPTHRTSVITTADRKHGSTGEFVIVGVEHTYGQQGDTVLVERQQIIYRAAPTATIAAPGPASGPPPTTGLHVEVRPDERLLFRYSALTFNTHRIHYDHDYATQIEGYPGLVVHGPLTATILAGLASRHLGAPLTAFSFRAQAPTFAGATIHLVAETPDDDDSSDGGGEAAVRAVRQDGITVMTGSARTG